MRSILCSIMAALLLVGGTMQLKAQEFELYIDSVAGIPDTIYDGQQVTFYLIVSMNSPLFYQGQLSVELEYGGNLYPVDSVVLANSLLSPSGPNTIQATHRFSTDNDLQIGDNVVVVWPRLGNGTDPPQSVINPYTFTITMVEPNGLTDRERPVVRAMAAPNPSSSEVRLLLDPSIALIHVKLYGINGRPISNLGNVRKFDVSGLPTGLYLLDVLTEKGERYTDRLLISR